MRRHIATGAAGAILALSTAQADIIGVSWDADTYTVDSTTGEGVFLGDANAERLNAMAASRSALMLATGPGGDIWSIDPDTGRGRRFHESFLSQVISFTFANEGDRFMYAAQLESSVHTDIYELDLSVPRGDSSIKRLIGRLPSTQLLGMATSPDGVVYAWDRVRGLVILDPTGPSIIDVNSQIGGSTDIQSIEFSPDGRLFAARDALWEIDPRTAESTLIGSGGYEDLRGIGWIPSPATLLVLAPLVPLMRRRSSVV